jgi:hypothetical protein
VYSRTYYSITTTRTRVNSLISYLLTSPSWPSKPCNRFKCSSRFPKLLSARSRLMAIMSFLEILSVRLKHYLIHSRTHRLTLHRLSRPLLQSLKRKKDRQLKLQLNLMEDSLLNKPKLTISICLSTSYSILPQKLARQNPKKMETKKKLRKSTPGSPTLPRCLILLASLSNSTQS